MELAATAAPLLGPQVAGSEQSSSSPDTTTVAAARPPPKKRRRLVISCIECHRRKQKCDRSYPCTNCTSRGKEHACRYETAATTAAVAPSAKTKAAAAPAAGDDPSGSGGNSGLSTAPGKAVNFGYAAAGGASTMGFLRRIDRATSSPGLAGDSLARITAEAGGLADDFGTRERYKNLIRQLPPRAYIEKLADVYFAKYNVHYYPLEYDVFTAQLAEWNNIPFSVFTTVGPRGLSPDLRAFPAVLFQVVATALLTLANDEPHPVYGELKYAGNMTFEDLACDYSESGVAVLSLLGKQQMSLNTVQAGFIRCSFLKYMAQVTEAWHAIGAAIRDAQEIGLHRESQDPRPVVADGEDTAAAVLRNQWEIQHRRSLWHMLCLWDVHTGLVLGRPLSTDGENQPPFPVDCPLPVGGVGGLEARSRTAVLPRGPDDPPTPMTRNMWTLRLLPLLREVVRLETSGPCPRDFGRVDQIHREMQLLEAQIPPCFRVENPDTRFDDHPACKDWLPGVRTILPQLAAFGYFTLHRPYVFTRPQSRTLALRACVDMLRGQRAQFEAMAPEDHRSFAVFFGTFDAIVLVATVFVLFPTEHRDLLPDALRHFGWAVERFEVLSRRNNLARSAVGVLKAIWVRLQRSLAASETVPAALLFGGNNVMPLDPQLAAAAGGRNDDVSPFGSGTLGATPSSSSTRDGGASSGLDTLLALPTPSAAATEPWSLPSDFDWSSIQTLHPTSDLIYNELMSGGANASDGGGLLLADDTAAVAGGATELHMWLPPSRGAYNGGGEGVAAANTAANGNSLTTPDSGDTQGRQQSQQGNSAVWQFEGDFGDDSIWKVLNLYTPF